MYKIDRKPMVHYYLDEFIELANLYDFPLCYKSYSGFNVIIIDSDINKEDLYVQILTGVTQ